MKKVVIEQIIRQDLSRVWEYWTSPDHIINWYFASPEWHCPSAEQVLEVGGQLKYRMAAKDESMAFDYTGTFEQVIPNELLAYILDDRRKVSVKFESENGLTTIRESFEVEDEHSIEMQRQGWQAILDNFKQYAESQNKS